MTGRAATTSIIEGRFAVSVGDPGTPVPKGWLRVPLLSIAELGTGHTPSRSRSDYWDGGIPWIAIPDARNHHTRVMSVTTETISQLGIENSAARILPAETVGLSRTASVGYVFIMGRPMATSQDFVTWTCSDALDPRFLMYALLAEGDDIRKFGKGSTHTTIYFPEVKAFHLSLAPKQEQRRIVAKVDSLRSRSSRARQELDHIPKLIERYKQAILAKAFSGELTADWRTTNSDVAWAQADSQQIRQRHDAYLNARRGSRLRELSVSDQADELPSTWLHGNLADVVDLLAGFAFKSGWYQKTGVRLLRGANIAPGALDWSDEVRLSQEQAADFDDYRLATGDIVIAMDRPMISGGFKIARVPEADDGALLVQRVSRIRPIRQLDPTYAWQYLNSQIFIGHAMSTATGSDLPHISANDILSAPIHLPPPAEQHEIARRLESALAWLDKITTEHARAKHLLPKLDQTILAKAFCGELVPQDPDDEPASVLLERIKAETEGTKTPKQTRRTT